METNIIYCGECAQVMRENIEDNSIDLTVTSPPYDNLRKYNGFVFPFEEIAKELYRVTKIGGVVVWVVADATIKGSETGTSFKQALYFKEIGFNLHDTMIYQKNSITFPDTVRYYHCFEYMFILSKGKPNTSNLINDKKNSQGLKTITGNYRDLDNSLKIMSGSKEGRKIKEYGVRNNVWLYNTGWQHSYKEDYLRGHPAILPEKLAEDHILSWSNENDIVFDPMCGSGTTLKMAKKNNRRYIGIDISQEYVDLSMKRIELC